MPTNFFKPGNPGGPGRPRKITAPEEARKFIETLVTDPVYRAKLLQDLQARKLAPQIEIFLWAHIAGQPKHRVEHTGLNDGPIGVSVVPVEQLTDAQLDVIEQVLKATSTLKEVVPVPEPENIQ